MLQSEPLDPCGTGSDTEVGGSWHDGDSDGELMPPTLPPSSSGGGSDAPPHHSPSHSTTHQSSSHGQHHLNTSSSTPHLLHPPMPPQESHLAGKARSTHAPLLIFVALNSVSIHTIIVQIVTLLSFNCLLQSVILIKICVNFVGLRSIYPLKIT